MRVRIVLVIALVVAIAMPVQAKERPQPLDARQGIEVGVAAPTNAA